MEKLKKNMSTKVYDVNKLLARVRVGIIPVLALLVIIFSMIIFNVEGPVYNPPYLLFILNTLFLSATTFYVAMISAKSYLKYGTDGTLLIGTGLLICSVVSFIAGWTVSFSSYVNFAVTVYNMGILIFAGLQLQAALISASKPVTTSGSFKTMTSTYVLAIIFVALVSITAWFGLMPAFFENTGPTFIRQLILVISIIFLSGGSLVFRFKYSRLNSDGIYWYSLGLGSFSIGLFAVAASPQVGDLLGWTGRIAQYIGSIFFLVALLRLRKGLTFEDDLSGKWADTFRTDYAQFETFFSKMLNGFSYDKIIVDERGNPINYVYLAVNKAFEDITGLKKAAVIGKKVTEVLPGIENDPANWIGVYGKVALSGEPAIFENYAKPLNKWFSVSAYSPKRGYFVAIFEDITERKKAERELDLHRRNLEKLLSEKTKQLKDSERLAAIGQTAGMVGHDIRNPLQAITSDLYLAKLELEELSATQQKTNALESLNEIQKNVDYMNKIVADLQDFARVITPTIQKVDLKNLCEEILFRNYVPENIKITCTVAEEAKILTTDAALIKRILSNLTNNAIQAMPNGGELILKAYKNADDFIITVQDTGVGIPPEAKEKLFIPLFTTKSKGQGFGLPVVKRMTEALGGQVTFESEEGKGTTFIIRLSSSRKENDKR